MIDRLTRLARPNTGNGRSWVLRALASRSAAMSAGTAGGTTAGAHGQLGHAGDTALGGFADLVVGYPVTDADVHVRTRQAGPDRPVAIQSKREWLSIS